MSSEPAVSVRIADHGVIGDMQTLALVGTDATIDWMCWPRFDSPSIFGSILDPDGGHWRLAPEHEAHRTRQLYLPDTNVLITRFHTEKAMVEVEDFMTVGSGVRRLVRKVTGVRGRVEMVTEVVPKPDYGRLKPEIGPCDHGTRITTHDGALVLSSTADLEVTDDSITCSFTISEGDVVLFGLASDEGPTPIADADDLFTETVEYWRSWVSQSTYQGRWREVVNRSALCLKLLTHAELGAMIAAGTTSLPEEIGGERNWDYRFVWIRDAAFTLYALLELGFTEEARDFTGWLEDRVYGCTNDTDKPLAPLYDLDGSRDLDEFTLDHWEGHAGSSPVRIGNAASTQLQLDIYGELIDSLYLADKRGGGVALDTWREVRKIVDWVCHNWDQPDEGMWEIRAERQQFTSSLLLCWVAIERGIRMATFRGRPADIEQWREQRDAIHARIVDEAWNEDIGAFTGMLGSTALDAAVLLMPLVKFISPNDPRWLSTLDAIRDDLTHGVLVDRYDPSEIPDGFDGEPGSFSICSFWYVENLARAGRVDEARLGFEKMLTYANHLGLYSEGISPTGDQVGNFPQAFTHLSLISAAVHLDEVLNR